MPHYSRTYPVPDRVDLCARDRALAWMRYHHGLEPELAEKQPWYHLLVAVIQAAEKYALRDVMENAREDAARMGCPLPLNPPPSSAFHELPPRKVEIDDELARVLTLGMDTRKEQESEGA